MTSRRKTDALVRVASVLMEHPDEPHWGYTTAKAAGVRSATLYRLLSRMLEDGWLADGWEDQAATGGRPPRRYYTVTDLGRVELSAVGQVQDQGARGADRGATSGKQVSTGDNREPG